jgi:hypothetical protein
LSHRTVLAEVFMPSPHDFVSPQFDDTPRRRMPVATTFLCCDEGKSWIPACAGMTGWATTVGRSLGRFA